MTVPEGELDPAEGDRIIEDLKDALFGKLEE
jgi:hypothetical protein